MERAKEARPSCGHGSRARDAERALAVEPWDRWKLAFLSQPHDLRDHLWDELEWRAHQLVAHVGDLAVFHWSGSWHAGVVVEVAASGDAEVLVLPEEPTAGILRHEVGTLYVYPQHALTVSVAELALACANLLSFGDLMEELAIFKVENEEGTG